MKKSNKHIIRKSTLVDGRFQNPWGGFRKLKFFELLKWLFSRKRNKWPKQVNFPLPSDLKNSHPPKQISFTLINHATFLIQLENVNILVDPVWSKRASPISWIGPKRLHSPSHKLSTLPKIDIILVSHAHYDHLDVNTLCWLIDNHNPLIITGLKTNTIISKKRSSSNIMPLDWNEQTFYKETLLTFLPAHHWSNRTLFDINKTLWGGFLIKTFDNQQIYFAGDTAFGNGEVFYEIKRSLGSKGLDVALLPIGAYLPRWMMASSHMSPEEAVQAHKILSPKQTYGFHFGTFPLSDEGYNQPIIDLNKALKSKKNFSVCLYSPYYWPNLSIYR